MEQTTVKELSLGLLAISVSIATFWLWKNIIPLIITGEFSNYAAFILPIAGLIFAGSCFALTTLFIKNHWLLYISSGLAVGGPYIFLTANSVVLGALIISVLLAISAAHHIRKECTLSLGFSLAKFLKAGLPIYFTAASLIVATYYFANLNEEKALTILLPKSAFNLTTKSLSGPLLKSLTGEQAVGNQLSPEVLYGVAAKGIENILGPYKKYLPAASATAFFFAFKTLTVPIYYLSLLLTFLLIKFLTFIKIIKSEKVQVEVNRLTL